MSIAYESDWNLAILLKKLMAKVSVGTTTLGHIINVIGKPINEKCNIKTEHFLLVHKEAPTFIEQATKQKILVTGIMVVGLLVPSQKGGKTKLFNGVGIGKIMLIMELTNNVAKAYVVFSVIAGIAE